MYFCIIELKFNTLCLSPLVSFTVKELGEILLILVILCHVPLRSSETHQAPQRNRSFVHLSLRHKRCVALHGKAENLSYKVVRQSKEDSRELLNHRLHRKVFQKEKNYKAHTEGHLKMTCRGQS